MARLLIVEDESVAAWYLQEALENMGHDVLGSVASGEEALELAEETRPELVLMDIRLEGEMDGIAAAEHIYSRFDIPVIYLTAHADDGTLTRAIAPRFSFSASQFLPKYQDAIA
jgi:CheY-like chemotaxis protein